MAWVQTYEPNESKFNPASFKMERLGEINKIIVQIRMNPFEYNPMIRDYNYKGWLPAIISLAVEGDAKFDVEERKTLQGYLVAIQEFIDRNEVIRPSAITGEDAVDKVKWKIISRHLLEVEKKVKRALDAHGLDTPNKRTGGLF